MERTDNRDMSGQWLNISEVAKKLGVHPSTVRSWADNGHIPVHRTKGGHRRFLLGDVDLWVQAQNTNESYDALLVIQNALKRTRFQISEGRLEEETWYQKIDSDAKELYRMSGRAMLNGLMSYLATDGKSADAESRALGYEYAARGRSYGLSYVEATRAFLFFRNTLVEAMFNVYEGAAVSSAYAWSEMFKKINQFTDYILLTLLETYSVHQNNKR